MANGARRGYILEVTMIHCSRKTLILTGASRGIGHATVKRFSTAGWRVITCSRHPFPEDCPWDAGPEDHIEIDLASSDDTHKAIAVMREKLKAHGSKLDALVNNAAISPKLAGGARMNSLDTSEHDWKTVFQINFFAPIMLARGLLNELKRCQRGGGERHLDCRRKACIPSRARPIPPRRRPLLRLPVKWPDFGPLGVRVNAISPGEIETSILSPGTEKIIPQIPLRRLGQPEEVAKAIYFLCTDASSYVSGAELHINGGQHV